MIPLLAILLAVQSGETDYPHPVRAFELTIEGQAASMAFMDVPAVKPNGETFDIPAPPVMEGAALAVEHAARDIRITPATAITRWTGEPLDLGLAVDVLLLRRGKSVSAETRSG